MKVRVEGHNYTTLELTHLKLTNPPLPFLLTSSSGPSLVPRINNGLVELLKRDGFDNITQAIGADHRIK